MIATVERLTEDAPNRVTVWLHRQSGDVVLVGVDTNVKRMDSEAEHDPSDGTHALVFRRCREGSDHDPPCLVVTLHPESGGERALFSDCWAFRRWDKYGATLCLARRPGVHDNVLLADRGSEC